MAKSSAGLLMYRKRDGKMEFLLVHPGGPFWAKKDEGSWSIPKGEVWPGEDGLAAARREFREELGVEAEGEFVFLGSITQKGGKTVQAWGFKGDCDPSSARSNTFELEWPPKSGIKKKFPEIDKAQFFDIYASMRKIIPAQAELLRALYRIVSG